MTAPILNFAAISHEAALERCRKSKALVKTAWRQHLADVLDFRKLYEAQHGKGKWEAFCDSPENEAYFYSASAYRAQLSSLPIAEIVEELRGEFPSKGFAKNLQGKLWEVIPKEERSMPLILSTLAICYAYDNKPMPDKQVIAEAFEIVKEEREYGTLSTSDGTWNVKQLAQNKRIKEAVVQTIIAHSKPQLSLQFAVNQGILAEMAKQAVEGKELPPIGAEITILWSVT